VARLLLIDDDVAVSLTLARMLEFRGHQVTRLESAIAGLDTAIHAPPDALILDMKMPQMGGLEFLRRLRATPGRETLPVGVITGDYFLGDAVLEELERLARWCGTNRWGWRISRPCWTISSGRAPRIVRSDAMTPRLVHVIGVPLDLGGAAAVSTWGRPRCGLPAWGSG